MAEPEPLTVGQGILAGFSLAALLLLLGGVATGYFYAVEAAAVGAFALLVAGLLTGRLNPRYCGRFYTMRSPLPAHCSSY